MPAETMSLEEFTSFAQGTGDDGSENPPSKAKIPPSVQAARDTKSLDPLHAEAKTATDPADKEALAREIHSRRQTSSQKTMSLGEFGKLAGVAKPTTTPVPEAGAGRGHINPAAAHVTTFREKARAAGEEVSAFGDLLLSGPAVAAGFLGEATMRYDQQVFRGIHHAGSSEAAAAFRNEIIEAGSPHWFADALVYHLGKTGKDATPTAVARFGEALTKHIQNGGKIMDKATGGFINEDDVGMAANGVMAALTVGGVRLAGKFSKAEEIKLGEKPGVTPKMGEPNAMDEKPDGAPPRPREAIDRPFKTVRGKPREFSQKQVDDMHHEWARFQSRLADEKAARAAQTAHEGMEELQPEVSEKGMPTVKPGQEGGMANTKLLTLIGVGATGAALAKAFPERKDDLFSPVLLAGMIGGGLGREGMSLGSIIRRGQHTLSTLDRLNQNHTEFPIKRIEEELRRPEVTKAEKDVFKVALADLPKDGKVTAYDLTKRLSDATGNFVLTPKRSDTYATHGLAKIDRGEVDPYGEHPRDTLARANEVLDDITLRDRAEMTQPPGHRYDDYPYTQRQAQIDRATAQREREQALRDLELWEGRQEPVSMIWRAQHDTNVENHFSDSRYFAHTRSFVEGGVKHVVEIQSDLVQKNAKPGPELVEAAKEVDQLLEKYNAARNAVAQNFHTSTQHLYDDLVARQRAAGDAYYAAAQAARGANNLPIAPMWKDWVKRIVREELAQSARNGEDSVRFGTGDTVAKVEGWPRREPDDLSYYRSLVRSSEEAVERWQGYLERYTAREMDLERVQRYVDEAKEELAAAKRDLAAREKPRQFLDPYQGIYDRYKKEVEPFITKLGGKPFTDKFGHTWIEVPTGFASRPGALHQARMFGRADIKLLAGIAGMGLGMTVGAYLDKDNPIIGAALGGIMLTKPISTLLGGAGKLADHMIMGDNRIRINKMTEAHDHYIQQAARQVAQVQAKVFELVPGKKRREFIHNAIDSGTVGSLTGKEKEAAEFVQQFYATIEAAAKKAGVLENGRDNYSTHIWRRADRGILEEIMAKKAGPSMAPTNRFAEKRTHVTMAEGKAAGLKPVTEDIAEVAGLYANSMYRSIANKKLLDRLQRAETPDGIPLVGKANQTPGNFQSINHPALQGLRVHPDIMPSMKFLFEAQDPHELMAAASAFNTALKRNSVSFSLFHPKSLADAMLGAVNNPLLVGKVIAQAAAPKIFGVNRYLKMVKEGGAGDAVDKLLKAGLRISYEHGESTDADVGGGFYQGMRALQDLADKVTPFGSGRAVINGYMRVNHAFDNFMWGRLHAAMKMEVAMAKVEALMENNAKAGTPIAEAEAYQIASAYANDVFGGLHWQRLAEGAKTKWGRDVALQMNSPLGRRVTQLAMFAPDWTLSTSRAFFKALPWINKGTGFKGLFSAKTSADLYRQQLARSALYYVAIGDAVNYMNSGHHIWQNDDWTYVDLGDGRKMQLSKHFMEPFHWMKNPGQQGLNKVSIPLREGATQALGVEYLNTKGRMPPMKNRATHLAKNLMPIAGTQFDNGAEAGAAGFFGVPIYGKTKEQQQKAAKEDRDKRHRDLLKQYRKSHGLD